ncbi:MAG: TonB-dependent receptor plug domain-containing protein [Prevotellaceae bacterium]|nr:TonB-dependent receptor plug domain-containing protein [Prevotellaceae bacterium]
MFLRHLFFILALFCVAAAVRGENAVEDSVLLNEVVVNRGSRANVSGLSSGRLSLRTDDAKMLPSLLGNTDMLKILELLPGIQTSTDGNTNLYVRGGDPGQNLLLYNDVPIYSPGHLAGIFPLFNADHVSTVDFLKSGADSRYGNFLSSVFSVNSKEAVPQKASLKGSVGLLSSQATAEWAMGKNWGASLSARKTYINLFLMPLIHYFDSSKNSELQGVGYDFYDFNATVAGRLSTKNRLTINALYSQDVFEVAENITNIDAALKWRNAAFSAKLETTLPENITLEQTAFYSTYSNRLSTAQADISINVLSSVEDIGYKNRLQYRLFGIPFESGVQYVYHNLLPQKSALTNADMAFRREAFGRNTAHDAAAFTAAVIRFGSKFQIEPGVRYQFFRSETQVADNFHSADLRFRAQYRLSATQLFRAGYSRNTQYIYKLTPSSVGLPTDFWVASSAHIRPQKGNEVSIGYYRSFADQMFELSTDIYYRNMENATEYNVDFGESKTTSFDNQILYGEGQAYGIELLLKKNYGKLTAWLSYSLGRSERRFKEINNGRVFPAKYDRTHDLSLVGAYTFNPKWDISLVWIYATGNAYTQPSSWYFVNNLPVREYAAYNSMRLPAYNRTDISVNYWFKPNNGINLSVHNLFFVRNPIYVFMAIQKDDDSGQLNVNVKRKALFTILPSISWRFKF